LPASRADRVRVAAPLERDTAVGSSFRLFCFWSGRLLLLQKREVPSFFYILTILKRYYISFVLMSLSSFQKNFTGIIQKFLRKNTEKHMKNFWRSKGDLIGLKPIFL
jgi:hypothetical protein